MLLLDEVRELVDGAGGIGVKLLSAGDAFFAGSPNVIALLSNATVVECMAQTAAVVFAGGADGRSDVSRAGQGYLGGIERMRFRRTLRAGDRLVVRVALVRRLGGVVRIRAEAWVGADLVAKGRLTLAIRA